jgi:hypothetical protein
MAINLALKALAAVGGVVAAKAARSKSKAEAQSHEANAEQAKVEATWRRQEAQQNIEDHRKAFYRFRGRNRAVYGKSGVKMSGTPMDVLMENEQISLLDEQRIMELGEHQAKGHETQAEMDRMKAKYAIRAGKYNMATSLLSAGQSMYAMKD